MDICIVNELNNKVVPLFKGYHQFTRTDSRKFHGITVIVKNELKGHAMRVPHEGDLELVHIILKNCTPKLYILGLYLDVEARLSNEKVESVWGQLNAITEDIINKGEATCIIGDFNRPETPNPTFGMRLLNEWIEGDDSLVELINNPKEHTRIDPHSKKGSLLDLCFLSKNISKCKRTFKVDKEKVMTPYSIIKQNGKIITKSTDHLAILLKLQMPMMVAKREKKRPIINMRNPQGWENYKIMSELYADKILKAIEETENVNQLESKIKQIDTEIKIDSFGIIWQAPGGGKKTKKRENRELNKMYEDQQKELDELIEKGLRGKDANTKMYNMRNLIQGPKIKPQEPMAINHPETGELITDDGEIKRISLEHNLKILKKDNPLPEHIEAIKAKEIAHKKIMNENDKDLWELDTETYKIVTDRIREKGKNVFNPLNKAGKKYKEAIFKYMTKLLKEEQIPSEYSKTTLFQIWKKKGSALDLNNMRFVHLRCWRSKLIEALATQKMKSKIVAATPNIQLGGMPKASSVEHLVTLKTWMKMKEQKKENGIFQVFDMKKFFDKESLLDCMDTLNREAKVDNKSYRIWYKLNADTRISVRTSVGDTAEKSIIDSIGQGSAGASLISSLNIGCAMERTFKYMYTSSIGHLRLNSLIFQDDISKMNNGIEQAREGCKKIDNTLKGKLLSVNYDKSKYLLIGNNRFRKRIKKKLQNNPMKMGGEEIGHSTKEKYLGDIINEKGCKESIQDTINERKRKLISRSEEIIQLSNTTQMAGLGHSRTAFNLFEAQIIPSLLNNAESWIGITEKQIKELQDFQDIFTRKVLHLAPSTTKALINWDVNLMPMKWRIASKKLQFMRKMNLKEDTNITKKALIQERIHNIKGLEYESRILAHEIGLENLLIYKFSKGDIKEAVRIKIKEEFKKEMEDSKKVCDRLSDDPEDNSYMSKLPLHRARVWIRYRARAVAGVKGNFKHSHVNNMGCRFCLGGSNETQDHLELCEGTRHERRGLDMKEERGLLDFWRRMKFKLAAVT